MSLTLKGHSGAWYNTDKLKPSTLSEISQSQKDKYCLIPLKRQKDIAVQRCWGKREMGCSVKWGVILGDEKFG